MKLFYISLLFLSIGCQSESNSNSATNDGSDVVTETNDSLSIYYKQIAAIDKPLTHLDIPFQEFDYNNNRGNTFQLETGTRIQIPKNGFEDTDGNQIKKNIKIRYRELHSISDIMLSGIKMTYGDSDFESAGMFEIRAFSGSNELKLRDNKSIAIDMASYREGNFNSFYMNEGNAEWELLGESTITANQHKQERLDLIDQSVNELNQVCHIEPREYQQGDLIFDLDYQLNTHRELELFNGAMWMIVGGKAEEEAFKKDRIVYDNMEISPKDSCQDYELTLRNNGKQKQDNIEKTYTVTPIWKGAEHKKMKKNFKEKIQSFRNEIKAFKKQRKIAQKEADILRSFKLKGMGIYNCDRTLDYLKLVTVGIVISCKEKIKSWWYITQGKQVAIKYYQMVDPNFKYNMNSRNSIMAVMSNGEVATVSEEAFHKAYKDYLNDTRSEKQIQVELTLEDLKPVETYNDFAEAITEL